MPASNLPNLGLQGDTAPHEDGWDVADRANLRRLDALLYLTVKDKDLATPPGSPADGDRYIVGPVPTGAWATHAGVVTVWNASTVGGHVAAWDFYIPKLGWRVWVEDEGDSYVYNGSWLPSFIAERSAWSERSFDMAKVVTSNAITGYQRLPTATWTDSIDGGTTWRSVLAVAAANKSHSINLEAEVNDEYNNFGNARWFRYLWIVRARVLTGIATGASATQFHGIQLGSPNTASPTSPPWPDPATKAYLRMYYKMDVEGSIDFKLMCETNVGNGVKARKVTQIGTGYGSTQKNATMEIIWNPYARKVTFNAYAYTRGTSDLFVTESFTESDVNELPLFEADVAGEGANTPFGCFAESGSSASGKPEVLWADCYRACRFRTQPATMWY